MRGRKFSIVLFIIFVFVVGYLLGSRGYLAVNKNSFLFNKTLSTLQSNYYGSFEFEGFLKGAVNSLGDPYTVLLNPQETQALNEEVKGEYSGIGVVIEMNETELLPQIISIFQNSPAEKAGLLKGDLIKSVDSQELKGLNLDEASIKIKGKTGTQVKLEILRQGKILDFTILREKINIPLVEVKYLEDGSIGYLRITMFSDGLNVQVKKTLDEFKAKEVKGVILDLRDNPGGLLSECVSVASNFIPSGVLVLTKNKSGEMSSIKVSGTLFNMPLVLLVNNGSASASEILASAIKYYKVGILVGEKTFGKGLIQQMFTVGAGYSLKVTIEEYLTPDKTPINKVGVTPDVEISNDPLKTSDLQLGKAIEIMKGKIK